MAILLCHFALCSSWLCCVFTHSALCPTYHLYSVLLYNLCCLPKGFPKIEKKNWNRLVQKWLCIAILHMDMQNGFKKHTFWIVKDSKCGKNKRLLNLYKYVSFELFEPLLWNAFTSTPGFFFLAEDQVADSQPTDSSVPVCQYSSAWARKTSVVHPVITTYSLLPPGRDSLKIKSEQYTDCVVQQYRKESVG